MKGDKELLGTLRGFDEFVNMVLDDVIEYEITPHGKKEVLHYDHQLYLIRSLQTHLDQILLNGANICVMVPGGDPSSV